MIEPEPLLSNPDKRILDVAGTRAFLVERKIEPLRLENWPSPKAVLFVLDESYRIEGYRGWLEHRIPTMARLSNVIFDPLLPSVLEDKAPGSAETVEFKITSKGSVDYFVIKESGEIVRVKHNDPMEKTYYVRIESLFYVKDGLLPK